MSKIKINMLSFADKVEGQGVGSAYTELIVLLRKKAYKELDIKVNKGLSFDVMHLHTIDPIGFMKQKLSKGKSLTYVHFMPNTLEGAVKLPKPCLKTYEWWVKKVYMSSDYLVTVNPVIKNKLVDMGYPGERIFYIPNFVSNKKFYPMKKNDIKRNLKKYGYKEEDFIAVGVGQLHNGKGIMDFVKCAEMNPDIEFIWVGGFPFGKLMDGYENIKKIYDNPPKNLRFTGIIPRREVNNFYNISDVFFFPSFVETFALVAIEAANTHKPLLLRDIPEYKEIYLNRYLKGNSVEDFCKHLRTLKEDDALYKKYKKYSKYVAKSFNEDSICDMWINLYKEITK